MKRIKEDDYIEVALYAQIIRASYIAYMHTHTHKSSMFSKVSH